MGVATALDISVALRAAQEAVPAQMAALVPAVMPVAAGAVDVAVAATDDRFGTGEIPRQTNDTAKVSEYAPTCRSRLSLLYYLP